MKKTFLDFINEKKQKIEELEMFNEAFKNSEVDKVHELTTSLFKKNIDGIILYDPNPYNTEIEGKQYLTYAWMQFDKSSAQLKTMWTFNYSVGENSSEVFSIDFYNAEASQELLLNPEGTKTSCTMYTMGSSIAYFLPVVYHIVNNQDFKLDTKKATEVANKIFKESVQESSFFIGAQEYRIFESLTYENISDAFNLNIGNIVEAIVDQELKDYKRNKKEKKDRAYLDRKKSSAALDKFKKLDAEYKEILQAIKGGASTLGELKLALKGGVKAKIVNKDADKVQKEIEPKETPDEAFKKMQKYVKLVIKGLQNSVIICGAPGVGKTYNVKKQLKAAGFHEGHNLFTFKAKASARSLYTALYEMKEKGKVVVIDDADCVVGPKAPEDCINILKAALDTTTDDEGRLVTYGVAGPLRDDEGDIIPKRFYYNGSVIILTNYQAGALNTALRGRSFIQDINFTTQDILDRIKRLMPDLAKETCSMKCKLKAFDYLNELLESGAPMVVSMRGFEHAAKMYQAAEGDPDWDEDLVKKMIREQMKLQAARATSKNASY